MLRRKMPHFRVTSVAQKTLCLSSLLCRREAGEKEKESARGTTGRGTRGRETLALFFFPSSPVRFLFFDYCCFCWDTTREPRRRRAERKVKMIAAIFSKRIIFELFYRKHAITWCHVGAKPPPKCFIRIWDKMFKMAAKQARKGLWVCWPFRGGLKKCSFSGAWYQNQSCSNFSPLLHPIWLHDTPLKSLWAEQVENVHL